MDANKPVFPNVACDDHRGRPAAPGYAVCDHVIGGEPVDYYEPPTATSLGQILCANAKNGIKCDIEKAALLCPYCANEAGFIPKHLD